jgi:large subunit ribosomal protein L19e
MKLNLQKKLAARIAKVGKQRVKVNPEAAEDIKAAITKADVSSLIAEGKIEIVHSNGVSRHRARKLHIQHKKGRRKGQGSRKGGKKARTPKKRTWINKIRLQRKTLSELKETKQLEGKSYRRLYSLAKGGFFRSKKHMLLFAEKNKMINKIETPKEVKK